MKKLLLGLMLLTSVVGFSQETEFTFNNERGMTDFVITPVEGKTAPEIYKQVIEWIKVTYKNPDKVILSTIENEYIRFEGSSSTLWCISSLGLKTYENTKYQIEIYVKEGKYKFDLISMECYQSPSQYSSGGWMSNGFFNKNLTPEQLSGVYKKDGTLRALFKYIQDVPLYFNDLNKSIVNASVQVKKDNW